MTEKKLAEIEAEANRRWPLDASLVIHRYGRLEPGDRIVLVATASPHREAALAACHFLIDWLKTDAPFWKSEETPDGERWVERRADDEAALERWKSRGYAPLPHRGRGRGPARRAGRVREPSASVTLTRLAALGTLSRKRERGFESYSAAAALASTFLPVMRS